MLVGVCVLETRVVLHIQNPALGITDGTASPFLLGFIVSLSGQSFEGCYLRALQAFVWLATFLCFMLVRRETGKNALGLVAASVFAGFVVALLDPRFSAADAVDLSTFLLFAYVVFCRPDSLPLTLGAFVVELVNHEAAVFIGSLDIHLRLRGDHRRYAL